ERRTTIANAQTKQVSFLDVQGAPARKAYEYRASWLETLADPRSVDTVLRFNNSSGGLGDQLPAGTVRVYVKDRRGDPQFIAEESLKSERFSSDGIIWHVPVPANGEATVTATFDTRY